MLHTNLLPEKEKNVIVLERSLRIIKFFGITVIGTLITGITLLVPSYLPLYFQNSELKRLLSIQQEAEKKIGKDEILSNALRVQTTISSLRQATDNSQAALDTFDLLAVKQPGIIVSEFAIDENANIAITGNAATRNDLLTFEKHLRDSSRFQDIASSLTDIIQETNINFRLKGTLKPLFAL